MGGLGPPSKVTAGSAISVMTFTYEGAYIAMASAFEVWLAKISETGGKKGDIKVRRLALASQRDADERLADVSFTPDSTSAVVLSTRKRLLFVGAELGSTTKILAFGGTYSFVPGLLLSPDGLYAAISPPTARDGVPDDYLVQFLHLKGSGSTVPQTLWASATKAVPWKVGHGQRHQPCVHCSRTYDEHDDYCTLEKCPGEFQSQGGLACDTTALRPGCGFC